MIAKAASGPALSAANNASTLEYKRLLEFCAKHVLENKGVVREFMNLGTKQLPQRMKKLQVIHSNGTYLLYLILVILQSNSTVLP